MYETFSRHVLDLLLTHCSFPRNKNSTTITQRIHYLFVSLFVINAFRTFLFVIIFFSSLHRFLFHRSCVIMLFHRWKRSFFFLFFFLLNVDQSVIYAIDRRAASENRHSGSYIAYWYTRTRRFKIRDSFTGGNSFPFLLVLVVGSCFRLPETSGIRFPVGFCSFEMTFRKSGMYLNYSRMIIPIITHFSWVLILCLRFFLSFFFLVINEKEN